MIIGRVELISFLILNELFIIIYELLVPHGPQTLVTYDGLWPSRQTLVIYELCGTHGSQTLVIYEVLCGRRIIVS